MYFVSDSSYDTDAERRLNASTPARPGNLTPCPADSGKYTSPLIEAQASDFIRRQVAGP